VNGYETYQIYQALRLHFTTEYDAVKYNYKTAVKKDTFERRKDRYFFEKLSRRYNKEKLIHYFTANLIHNSNMWIGDMNENIYNEYVSRYDKLTYMLTQDMKVMCEKGYTFDQLCTTSNNNTTNPLLEALRSDEIQTESVVLIDIMVNFLKKLKGEIVDPLGINKDMINLLLKYKLIMLQSPLPRAKLKEKLLNTFTNSATHSNIDSVVN
jgi:hypothetical protein